ncbi:hypothetical protein [Candidatus Enterococcus huntleyi]|nr:hypothetical protein [Enterococcus sp. JM4C]
MSQTRETSQEERHAIVLDCLAHDKDYTLLDTKKEGLLESFPCHIFY